VNGKRNEGKGGGNKSWRSTLKFLPPPLNRLYSTSTLNEINKCNKTANINVKNISSL